MRVLDIANIIENAAPKDTACSFDNVGLMIGDYNDTVKGVMIAVDLSKKAIQCAVENNCNLIITHHPILFKPIKSLLEEDYASSIILEAVRHNINVYSAHTNMDKADCGINMSLARELGGENIIKAFEDEIGVIFDITPMRCKDFAAKLNAVAPHCVARIAENGHNKISRVALISGCGGRDSATIKELASKKCDLFVTGEIANHVEMELNDRKIAFIEYYHAASERIFNDIVQNLLADVDLKMVKW